MLVFYLAALDSDDNKNKFETIYRKYYRFMLHTAAGIIKNPTLAEDALQKGIPMYFITEADVLREQILRALRRNNGRRREAAAELFMSERTLYRKIKELGIDENS